MFETLLRRAADEFIDEVYLSCNGIEADRLALMSKDKKDLGGYCKEAMRMRLYAALGLEAAKEPMP